MNAKNVLVFLLIIGLLVGGYVYLFVWNKEHPEYKELKADYTISAKDLYDDFISDAESSGNKFNGKMLQITGEAHSVEKVDSLTIAVYVFNEGMFGNEGVRCTFLPEENIEVVSDVRGKQIKGFCSGYNDTDVIIEKCSIVK